MGLDVHDSFILQRWFKVGGGYPLFFRATGNSSAAKDIYASSWIVPLGNIPDDVLFLIPIIKNVEFAIILNGSPVAQAFDL